MFLKNVQIPKRNLQEVFRNVSPDHCNASQGTSGSLEGKQQTEDWIKSFAQVRSCEYLLNKASNVKTVNKVKLHVWSLWDQRTTNCQFKSKHVSRTPETTTDDSSKTQTETSAETVQRFCSKILFKDSNGNMFESRRSEPTTQTSQYSGPKSTLLST